MKIQQRLFDIRKFEDLLPIAERASAHISFLGDRHVTVDGCEGFLDLDDLADKVKELIMRKISWDEKNRQLGKQVSDQIDRVYSECFEKEEKCNVITRLFCQIKNYMGFSPSVDLSGAKYFRKFIRRLFESPNIQYVQDNEYDFLKGYKYLEVMNCDEFPETAFVKITDSPFRDGGVSMGDFYKEHSPRINAQILLSSVGPFEDLLPLVEKAAAKISFWGKRYVDVDVPECKGSLSIDDLADKVEELIMKRVPWDVGNRQTREHVSNEVKRVYEQLLDKTANCGWITWLFLQLRSDFFINFGFRNYHCFSTKIAPLFDSPNIEFEGDAEYNLDNGFRYLQVLDSREDREPAPENARVRIVDKRF